MQPFSSFLLTLSVGWKADLIETIHQIVQFSKFALVVGVGGWLEGPGELLTARSGHPNSPPPLPWWSINTKSQNNFL